MGMVLGRIWSRIRRWPAVARLMDYELRFKEQILREFGLDHGLPTVDLLELVPEIDETIDTLSFLGGSASPVEMAMLKGLAREHDACRYLEIGTFRGESAVNVAGAARETFTVALPPDEMRAAGYPEDLIEVHGFFSRSVDGITHIQHDSRTYDYTQLGGPFDLIFIDGDHAPESVAADTRNAFAMLRDSSSTIVWHDYGLANDSVRWSVLAGILAGCPESERRHLYHVSHTHCALFTRRSFASTAPRTSQTPNAVFSIRLAARKL